MACRLCLEKADDVLAIESDEGIQSNVAAILDKYFQFCFAVSGAPSGVFISHHLFRVIMNNNFSHSISQGESNRGVVCRKCWWEVKMFHDFYSRIEAVHCVTQGNESIFVRNVTEHLKIDLVTKEENTEFKRCTDEDCQTAEYLRDRFCNSKNGSISTRSYVNLHFPFQQTRHHPNLVYSPCHWCVRRRSPSRKSQGGKRKA